MEAISITQAAEIQIKALCKTHNQTVIRVRITGKGCSGNAYNMDFIKEDEIQPLDEVITRAGFKFIIENTSLMGLLGTELDWVEDEFASKFNFRNPNVNEDSFCGCGESFSLKGK